MNSDRSSSRHRRGIVLIVVENQLPTNGFVQHMERMTAGANRFSSGHRDLSSEGDWSFSLPTNPSSANARNHIKPSIAEKDSPPIVSPEAVSFNVTNHPAATRDCPSKTADIAARAHWVVTL